MPEFDFRVAFRLPGSDHIASDAEELLVLQEPDGRRLRLRSGALGRPLKERSLAAVVGGSYPSEKEASEAAARAKHALLMWSVRQGIGIDLGDGQARSIITNAGLKMFQARLERPVRNAILGIDVYEHQDNLVFAELKAGLSLGKGSEVFVEQVAEAFRHPLTLTEKQVLAAEIYGASFFDESVRSRLITLVTAVEALLERADRCSKAQTLVTNMVDMVRKAEIPESSERAMRGSLQWLKKDSIGETGRALAKRLLGQQRYHGMDASAFFTHCYNLRSQILHSGKPDNQGVDVAAVSNECQKFVSDLLRASIGLTP